MSLEERLNQFHEAGLDDIKIRVHRDRGASDAQRGYLTTQWTVGEVCDHGNFFDLVSEAAGGGEFHAEFLEDLQPMKTGDGKVEKYQFAIAGKPRKDKEKEEKKASQGMTLETFLTAPKDSLLGALVLGRQSGDGNDLEKAAEVLVKLKQLVPEPEAMNPLEMLDSLLGIIEKVSQQIKPPPVNTQGGGGFWSALATQLGPTVTNLLTGQQPAQLPQQAGFAGTRQMQQQAAAPQGGQAQQPGQYQQPEQSKVIEMPQQPQRQDQQAVNPFAKLRAMWLDRNISDQDLAVFAVEVIDSYVKFQMGGKIPEQFLNLMEDPGAALDMLLALLPDVDFRDKAQLKEYGVEFIEQWQAQSERVQQGMENVSGEEFAAGPGDGGTGTPGNDQSQDQDGEEHRRPGEVHSPEHSEIQD